MSQPSYENIIVETQGKVGIVRLNRPQALNALSPALLEEFHQAVAAFEADANISCMIVTGSEKAFAAARTSRRWPRRITSTPT